MFMTKICYPCYGRGKFASLESLFKYVAEDEMRYISPYSLINIVQCNIPYRDHLRSYGIDSLVERLYKEAPQLKDKPMMIQLLREWAEDEPIADYDIQYLHVNDKITILGHTFNGLREISLSAELWGCDYGRGVDCTRVTPAFCNEKVHVADIYKGYPSFDCTDVGDHRAYHNYIFRDHPISEKDVERVMHTPHGFNFCMMHEHICEDQLPILYYSGSGKYMVLASKKSE